jgi:YHS domain-containing protein
MFTKFRVLAMVTALGLGLGVASSGAQAGPQYVDKTGYAASGYDVVAYHALPQSEAGQSQPKAVAGKTVFEAEWNGAKWAFASAENRKAFLADPAKYAPKFDGHCSFGVAQGCKVPANPHLWRIVDGELHLNYNPGVVRSWNKDISGYRSSADVKWLALNIKPASSDAVSNFDISAAPLK